MANLVRLCHPADFQFMFEFDGKRVKGGFGSFVGDLLQHTERKSNVTFVWRAKNDGFGEAIHGTNDQIYSGCIGLIQRNQSDVILSMVNYPIPAVNLTQGIVVMDSTLQFVNTYKPVKHGEATQVESMFDSFSSTVWILVTFVLIICVCLLLIHERLRRVMSHHQSKEKLEEHTNQHFFYQVATHMTGYGQLDDSDGSVRTITFLALSFSCFMTILYLSSLMSTDLVVIPPPFTMRSYKEMLEGECSVWFFNGADTYQPFKSAADGSFAKRLWDWTTSKYPMDQVIFDGNKTPPKLVLQPLISGKSAFVTDSVFMTPILKEMCALALDEARLHAMSTYLGIEPFEILSVFPLASQDENAVTFLKAFVTNQHPSPGVISLVRAFTQTFEAGIPEAIIRITTNSDFVDTMLSLPKSKGNVGLISNCIQNHIFVHPIDPEQTTLANLSNLPRIFACIMALNFFLLFVEIFIKNRKVCTHDSLSSPSNRLFIMIN